VTPLPIQVVNDYERDVFNGDQGFVVGVLPDGALDVEFPPAQPSTGGASYGKQPSAGSPADAPGATLANVVPAQLAQAGAASGQAPPIAEAPTPPQPRRLQYLGRQVMLDILYAIRTATCNCANGLCCLLYGEIWTGCSILSASPCDL
jgi:hypothetical protein